MHHKPSPDRLFADRLVSRAMGMSSICHVMSCHKSVLTSHCCPLLSSAQLLHAMVDVVERKPYLNQSGGTVVLKCKDFRIIQLEINGSNEFNNVCDSIEWLSNLDDPRLLYPHFYRAMFELVENGWTAFQIESEFKDILMFSDDWRISSVNKDFAVLLTFGQHNTKPDLCLRSVPHIRRQ